MLDRQNDEITHKVKTRNLKADSAKLLQINNTNIRHLNIKPYDRRFILIEFSMMLAQKLLT